MKKFIITIATVAAAVSCSSEKKVLVLYYSQSGATQQVAEEIAKRLGADIELLEVEEPYNGNFMETVERCAREKAEGHIPALRPLKSDLSEYDLIFLGFPVWNGIYATPVSSLFDAYKIEGKKIVPFCTYGSGGLNTSSDALREALPGCEILPGYGVRNARLYAVKDEVNRFLIEQNYIDGSVETLPEYGEAHPVSEEEAAIFDAACSSYQFPLGTPVAVGSRKTSAGTDYRYDVESAGPAGVSRSVIYVSVFNGRDPEFTEVVR